MQELDRTGKRIIPSRAAKNLGNPREQCAEGMPSSGATRA
jgi:hypothetical protein